MSKIREYIKLIRVKHYLKNFLIFVPAFFGETILEVDTFIKLIYAFVAFSFTSSFIYIINDIKDVNNDRKHEMKKNRPIASGRVSVKEGIVLAFICLMISVSANVLINSMYCYSICAIYVVINILYTYGLKNYPIVDVFVLASGFVMRLLYGACASRTLCSDWLLLVVMALSLYMGLGKRYSELIRYKDDPTRNVLKLYNAEYLDSFMKICISIGIVFYSLWAVSLGENGFNSKFVWTIPVVVFLIMRYQYRLNDKKCGDPIELIYGDKVLMLLVLLYCVMAFLLKYVMKG